MGLVQCFARLTTMPVSVLNGEGPTLAEAHNHAARNALQESSLKKWQTTLFFEKEQINWILSLLFEFFKLETVLEDHGRWKAADRLIIVIASRPERPWKHKICFLRSDFYLKWDETSVTSRKTADNTQLPLVNFSILVLFPFMLKAHLLISCFYLIWYSTVLVSFTLFRCMLSDSLKLNERFRKSPLNFK